MVAIKHVCLGTVLLVVFAAVIVTLALVSIYMRKSYRPPELPNIYQTPISFYLRTSETTTTTTTIITTTTITTTSSNSVSTWMEITTQNVTKNGVPSQTTMRPKVNTTVHTDSNRTFPTPLKPTPNTTRNFDSNRTFWSSVMVASKNATTIQTTLHLNMTKSEHDTINSSSHAVQSSTRRPREPQMFSGIP